MLRSPRSQETQLKRGDSEIFRGIGLRYEVDKGLPVWGVILVVCTWCTACRNLRHISDPPKAAARGRRDVAVEKIYAELFDDVPPQRVLANRKP